MRILILGGTGFIGPTVVRQLHALGHEVALFHRGQTTAELPPDVQHILGDRSNLLDFTSAFATFAPDVALDMWPFSEEDARAFMRLCNGLVRRVVAISSQDVYRAYAVVRGKEPGPVDPLPLTEDAPLRQRLYPYRGETPKGPDDPERWVDDYEKILVERVVMGDAALPGTILRLPAVYGPGDDQHRLFEFLKRMDDQRPAILLGEGLAEWRWTRGYVENVAAAVALAVLDERAAGQIYNVGEPQALSMAEWVRAIAQVAGWRGEVVIVPEDRLPAQLKRQLRTDQHLVTDSTRIRQALGYRESVSLDEALRRTIAWERAHPPAQIDLDKFDYAAEDAALTGQHS